MNKANKATKVNKAKLTGLIVFSVLMAVVLSGAAAGDTTEIAASRRTINEKKQKIERIKTQQSKTKVQLKELETLRSDTAAYIEKLDGEVKTLNEEISLLTEAAEEAQIQIDLKTSEMEEACEREARQYASMKKRIRYMYEHGSSEYVDMIITSGTPGDFLYRTEYVSRMTKYDREKLKEYVETREQILKTKAELEAARIELEEDRAAAEQRRSDAETLENEKKKELSAYEARIDKAEDALEELDKSAAGLQAAIRAEENKIAAIEERLRKEEEEARRKAEANGETYVVKDLGSIHFKWPCPASGRITSYFGSREAPVKGASTSHKGIDIGAPGGSTIIAAAEGTVVIATYSSSAGNYVMLNHGGGVCTVYMHMSSIKASVGDEVDQGDTIGYVGSTGYSSGPHLHFGIRNNGTYIDPLGYVSP